MIAQFRIPYIETFCNFLDAEKALQSGSLQIGSLHCKDESVIDFYTDAILEMILGKIRINHTIYHYIIVLNMVILLCYRDFINDVIVQMYFHLSMFTYNFTILLFY